jgi:hypothetical protein
MPRNMPRPIPGMRFPGRQPEPARALVRHPNGITALHESSHAVIAALLETPGFESVDVKTRTRETHPNCGIPAGFISAGFTKIVWPEMVTKGRAYKRVFGVVAPGITAEVLHYKDDGIKSDIEELVTVATYRLGVNPDKLLRETLRLTRELVRNSCVFATIMNTAASLLDRTELSADDVRGILNQMRALASESVRPFSVAVQELIGSTELIENRDRLFAKLAALQSAREGGDNLEVRKKR